MGKAQSKLSPEAVSELQKKTHFDKKEIQVWYQAFLKECPYGYLSRDRFLSYYDNFFPFGDPTAFAGHLYRTYDPEGNGRITFEQYLEILSAITRGRLEEKVRWAFQLYDHDGDGRVSRADMTLIVDAIYRMLGTVSSAGGSSMWGEWPEDEATPKQRVDKIFKQMGLEGQSSMTLEEFSEGIQTDPSAIQCLLIYDGVV